MQFQVAFLQAVSPEIAGAPGAHSLLQNLPDIGYFAKDRQGRFIAVNASFMAMAGCKSESQLLGRTDHDIWPRFLADYYVKDDARVMETAAPLVNKIELILRRGRTSDWFATTKVPLLGPSGEVTGIEGLCRYLRKARAPAEPVLGLAPAIDYIMEHYAGRIDVPSLAALVGLSVKQFERRFKREYGAAPVQYILRIRLDAARQLLAGTRLPIAQIGRETGFYDNSHFTHQFQKYTGFPPKAFREKHGLRPG
jgi:AraC-like DNA-binding protein